MPASSVTVIGGGPAGAMAALAARRCGAEVTLYEPKRFPRHKVCGEFLSSEAAEIAGRLGVWDRLMEAGAVPIRRILLRVGRAEVRGVLERPAHGISRYAMDSALLRSAMDMGVQVVRSRCEEARKPAVWAAGRSRLAAPGQARENRLFGFKAHFSGPAGDAVELYLFDGCYIGVSPVEGGKTNVCGLGPLKEIGLDRFDPDALIDRFAPLRDRLLPLRRDWDWMGTGPLRFGARSRDWGQPGIYPAGDALGFADPFTGAGMAHAIASGAVAGRAAAEGRPVDSYLKEWRGATRRMFAVAGVLRLILGSGLAGLLAPAVPAELLFRLTRPRFGG